MAGSSPGAAVESGHPPGTAWSPGAAQVHVSGVERSISGEATRSDAARPSSPGSAGMAPGQVMGGGRYQLVEKAGEGGMGAVWKARDLQLGREVAIKRGFLSTPVARERFRRETRAILDLAHPNIVPVHDAGEDENGPFLVMQFVRGRSLAQRLAAGRMDGEEAVATLAALCRGAAHAHKKGVVHRDIKPGNVMLNEDGTPMLVDFGLVRVEGATELSLTGIGMGTLDYAAPEQKRDASKADARSDVYALGLVFYEMLTGLHPPVTLRKVPEPWRPVVEKATDGVAADRYASADELLDEVEALHNRPVPAIAQGEAMGGAEELRCTSCRQLNGTEAKFCRSCGEALWLECPACNHLIRVTWRQCDQCSANVAVVQQLKEQLPLAQAEVDAGRLVEAQQRLARLQDAASNAKLGPASDLRTRLTKLCAEVSEREARARELVAHAERQAAAEDLAAARSHWEEALRLDLRNQAKTEAMADILNRSEASRSAAMAKVSEGADAADQLLASGRIEDAERTSRQLQHALQAQPKAWHASWMGRIEQLLGKARAQRQEAVKFREKGERLLQQKEVAPAIVAFDQAAALDGIHADRRSEVAARREVLLTQLQAEQLVQEGERLLGQLEFEAALAELRRAAALDRVQARRLAELESGLAAGIASRDTARAALRAGLAAVGLAVERMDPRAAQAAWSRVRALEPAVGSEYWAQNKKERLAASQAVGALVAEIEGRRRRVGIGIVATCVVLLGICFQQYFAWREQVAMARTEVETRIESARTRLGTALDGSRRLESKIGDGVLGAFQRGLTRGRAPGADFPAGSGGPGVLFLKLTESAVREAEKQIAAAAAVPIASAPDAVNISIHLDAATASIDAISSIEARISLVLSDPRWQPAARVEASAPIRDAYQSALAALLEQHAQAFAAGNEVARTAAVDKILLFTDQKRVTQWGTLAGKTATMVATLQELLPRPDGADGSGPVDRLQVVATAVTAQYQAVETAIDLPRWERALADAEACAKLVVALKDRTGEVDAVWQEARSLLPPVIWERRSVLLERCRLSLWQGDIASAEAALESVASDKADRQRWLQLVAAARDVLAKWERVPVQHRQSADSEADAKFRAVCVAADTDLQAVGSALQVLRGTLATAEDAWIDACLQLGGRANQELDVPAVEDLKQLAHQLDGDPRFSRLRALSVSARLLMAGLRALPGAGADASTGFPMRVVHQATGAVLLLISAGKFAMGSPATEADRDSDETQHPRVIRKAFYLGETEVSQAQWERVMGNNPSRFRGAELPVESVSWDDCQEFLRKAGGGLRLPSETEWEYACRAGTTTPFSFGATITPEQVNYDGNYPYGNGPKGRYRQKTVACRSLPANAWGLYEMHGNVWEWCQDVKAGYPGHGDERAWEEGAGARVLRGGGWIYRGPFCRAAVRSAFPPFSRDAFVGLRLARTLPE